MKPAAVVAAEANGKARKSVLMALRMTARDLADLDDVCTYLGGVARSEGVRRSVERMVVCARRGSGGGHASPQRPSR